MLFLEERQKSSPIWVLSDVSLCSGHEYLFPLSLRVTWQAAITSWRNASAPEPSVGEAMKVLPLTTTPPVSPLLSVVGLCCSLCLYFYSQLQQGSIHCQLGASLPRQELYLLQSTFLELKVKKKVEVLAFGLVCCFFFFLVKRWRETRWKRTWAWD